MFASVFIEETWTMTNSFFQYDASFGRVSFPYVILKIFEFFCFTFCSSRNLNRGKHGKDKEKYQEERKKRKRRIYMHIRSDTSPTLTEGKRKKMLTSYH